MLSFYPKSKRKSKTQVAPCLCPLSNSMPMHLYCLSRCTIRPASSGRRFWRQNWPRYLGILEQQEGIKQIILFGSMVTQQIHEYSDIDLIVIQRSNLTFLKRSQALRQLFNPKVGTDLLVYTPEEFQQMREGLFFQAEIISKGVVVSTSGQWFEVCNGRSSGGLSWLYHKVFIIRLVSMLSNALRSQLKQF